MWRVFYCFYCFKCDSYYFCNRLVSEMNVEKKPKSSRGKNKSSEGRKQLASVRVIQRNLVYVVGLPLNMADEDVGAFPVLFSYPFSDISFSVSLTLIYFLQLLQRREYFGQYGKVLKVSISRTASGAIQHFANSTCSV